MIGCVNDWVDLLRDWERWLFFLAVFAVAAFSTTRVKP